jgi:predicted nucleic acid-binding protein
MIVVSDTSVLLYLAKIELIDPLPGLYGNVVIPPQVERELRHVGFELKPAWLSTRSPSDRLRVAELMSTLDPG